MAFPSAVRADQAYGVIGELQFDSPLRVQPGRIAPAATAANCVIGRYFSKVRATGEYTPGGDPAADATLIFGGILGFPKEQALTGSTGDPLAPSLFVAPGKIGSFVEMGMVNVYIPNAAVEGDIAVQTIATGVISTVTPAGVAGLPGTQKVIPNTVVYRSRITGSNGVLCLKLTN